MVISYFAALSVFIEYLENALIDYLKTSFIRSAASKAIVLIPFLYRYVLYFFLKNRQKTCIFRPIFCIEFQVHNVSTLRTNDFTYGNDAEQALTTDGFGIVFASARVCDIQAHINITAAD